MNREAKEFTSRVGCPIFRFFWSTALGIEIGIPDRSNNDQEKKFRKNSRGKIVAPGVKVVEKCIYAKNSKFSDFHDIVLIFCGIKI